MPTAKDILDKKSPDVAVTGEDATVMEAATMMNELRIGALVVVREDKVVGIFTERDILNRVVAKKRDPSQTPVKEVMTSPVASCQPGTSLAEIRGVMTEKRIRHLPIVQDNRLVGMLSIGDILASENREQQQTIQFLHEYLYTGTR